MTGADDERLAGRHPEFARMSNRPGLGSSLIEDVASTMLQYGLDKPEHLPSVLQHGKKRWPLGRYLRNRLRERLGISKEEMNAYTSAVSEEKLRALRENSQNAPAGFRQFAFKQAIIDASLGRRIQIEARQARSKRKDGI